MAHNDLAQSARFALKGNVLSANCPSRLILQHVTSRWGTLVLIALSDGTLRFAQVKRRIDGISERMLAQTLQVLESDHLVLRVAHDVVPPHVEYSLTPLGREVATRVLNLSCWIQDNLPALVQG
jgi:DNA-binding HxlR family transcriptional regulator